MTKDDKKARRKARHQMEKRFQRGARRLLGLYSTAPQIQASLKIVVDRYFSAQREAVDRIKVQALG